MNKKVLLRTITILFLLALNIGCDQVSKAVVRHKLQYYDRIEFLQHHFTIQKVENTGAFLSLGDSLSGPVKTVLLNILPLLAVLFGLYYILTRTNLNRTILTGIILIVGGGAGNLYDRVVHGSVTDFMYINFVLFHTGVFNVADMSIMAGMFIILIHTYVVRKNVNEPGNDSKQPTI